MDLLHTLQLFLEKRLKTFRQHGEALLVSFSGACGNLMLLEVDVEDAEPRGDNDDYTALEPALYSDGMRFVLVNGTLVVNEGHIVQDVFPGEAIRAPLSEEAG